MLRDRLIAAVLHLNRVPMLCRLSEVPYDVCLATLGRACAGLPGVRALYIPRDYHARRWVPGSSDIDLCVVLHTMTRHDEEQTLERLWQALLRLGRLFPFLSTGFAGVPIYSEEDLAQPEFGWRAVALHAHNPPERWTLVYGQESRELIGSWERSPPRRTPASPDLLGLVDKHIHAAQIHRRPHPLPAYLGSEQRMARKILAVLAHEGTGGATADPGGELEGMLEGLELQGGFLDPGENPEAARQRLGLMLLRALEAHFPSSDAPDRGPGAWSGRAVMSEERDLLAELGAGLPPSAGAVCFPRSHLVGADPPVERDPMLGICVILATLAPRPYGQVLGLLTRLQRRFGARRIHFRVMGLNSWAALNNSCATNYVFEGRHMRHLGVSPAGAGAVPLSPPPEDDVVRLAITRRLTVERCHVLRSCLAQHHLGAPLARCLNPLLSLTSYRIYLAGGPPLTLAHEILGADQELLDDPLGRRVRALCSKDPDTPVTRSTLQEYRACSLDMLESCFNA